MKSHTYKWDNVVIGNTLEAVLCAKFNNSKLIVNGLKVVHEYDVVSDPETLKKLGYTQKLVNKQRLLNRLLFDISLAGYVPISEEIKSIRVDSEKNQLTVISRWDRRTIVQYKKLRIFDDALLEGVPFEINKEVTNIRVYDWFAANIINTVKYKQLIDEETNFARKITVRKVPKNLVIVESNMKENQLKDFNYSDTMARLRATKVLKEAGLTGQKNGFYKSNPEKPRYRPVKLDFLKRDVIKEYKTSPVKWDNILFDDSGY